MHIFDNNNFSIIPKSIFSDNDNLPISCKNDDRLAIIFFDYSATPTCGANKNLMTFSCQASMINCEYD